jgi:hypothetical protein
MNNTVANKLALATQHWLDFQIACNRASLLDEGYLAQPIVEFLQAEFSGQTPKELTIPNLANAKKGMNRRVDFAVLSPQTQRVTAAIETKWVTTAAKQTIVDDLLRLELFSSHQNQSFNRFFLIGGRKAAFNSNFRNAQVNSNGARVNFLTPLLSFAPQNHAIDIVNSVNPWKKYFKAFCSSYNVSAPRRFETQLVGHATGCELEIAIWRVKSSRRRTLVPQNW